MPNTNRRPQRRTRGRSAAGAPGGTFATTQFDPRIGLASLAIVAISLAPLGLIALLAPGSATSSLLLASAIYLPCLIFAAMTLHFGRATPVKARLVAGGFAFGGLAFAIWGGLTDYHMRAITLLEIEVEGSTTPFVTGQPPVRELSFTVEHPGVEHTLIVWPVMPGPREPDFTATVRVEVRDAEEVTLFAHEEQFAVRSSGDSRDWGSASVRFTPAQAGRHTLLVTPTTPGIPRVHVRIEDPLKRDGVRPPGY